MSVTVRHTTLSNTGQWWVVNTSPPSGSPTEYTVIEGSSDQAFNYPGGGGVSGPYSSLSAANAVAGKEPVNANQSILPGVSVTPGGSVNAGPLTGVADFLTQLSSINLWIRVGEVVFGLILAGVGLAHLTGTNNVIAKAVGTVIP